MPLFLCVYEARRCVVRHVGQGLVFHPRRRLTKTSLHQSHTISQSLKIVIHRRLKVLHRQNQLHPVVELVAHSTPSAGRVPEPTSVLFLAGSHGRQQKCVSLEQDVLLARD